MAKPATPLPPDKPEPAATTHRTGSIRTGSLTVGGTGLGIGSSTKVDLTSLTLAGLAGASEAPDLGKIKGLKLQQQLLITVISLIVGVVALSGVISVAAIQRQFRQTGEYFTQRFQEQARELGATISQTISLSSASSLRDNNYGMLAELVRDVVRDNSNIVRLRVLDAEGRPVADSDTSATAEPEQRKFERSWTTSAFAGRPVFEYQEPIDYGSSSGKGLVLLSYSLDQLQQQLQELEGTKREAVAAITRRSLVLAGAFILIGLLVALLQSRRIARSLELLTDGAMKLAGGDLQSRVAEPKSAAREVRALGAVFNYMGDRLAALLDSVRARAALERDVELARQVQSSLLPSRDPIVIGSARIAGACVTADACGGDWWIFSAVDASRVVIGIGDVTGHGLSTALIASSATSGFAAALKLRGGDKLDVAQLIASLNQTLHTVAHGQHQMSSALAVVNTATGDIEYAAGGHPAALTYNRLDKQVAWLSARGPLLGSDEKASYTPKAGKLRPGDLVVWFTDGLTEARDPNGKVYGPRRLTAILEANSRANAEQIRDAILADVATYTDAHTQQDDITLIVLDFSSMGPTV